MADVALWSGATGAGNGSSWTDAYTTLAAALAVSPSKIFVASDHSELVSTTLVFPVISSAPVQIISSDMASGYPPTAELAGASIGSTNATNLSIQNSLYSKGVFWGAGDNSTVARNIVFDSTTQVLNQTVRIVGGGLELKNTGSGSRIVVGTGSTSRTQLVILEDAEIRFGHVSQGIQMQSARLQISGGATAGSAITEFIKSFSLQAANIDVSGLDMSSCATGVYFLAPSMMGNGSVKFDRCRMPTSWTGGISSNNTNSNSLEVTAINCDSADTNYRLMVAGNAASVRQETTIVRTGGASDGVTPISWAVVTGTQNYPLLVMKTPEINVWNDTVGSAVTVTAEVITDGVTLTDEDAWIEVSYLSNTGYPLGAMVSDEKSNMLAAASNQDSSAATWTTTGMTSPVKQKLSVTFTPQEKGFISARVRVARSSTTVYVCPKIEVS